MTQIEADSPGRTGWGSGRRRGLVEGEAGMRRRETWRSRRSSRSSVRRFGGKSAAPPKKLNHQILELKICADGNNNRLHVATGNPDAGV
ncbi:hypothetical protein E2562_037548 [Oryza meyeriana var. granulata]|uniref:Uncharacterized protein n=1 Tax=Oryza meyeriana var. granulata TaxID=110450 RepID=A0A6G1DS21_9ORYZ|nr:hypothetical protein E2562_037548 [Oryza meyeriana var. granulata]